MYIDVYSNTCNNRKFIVFVATSHIWCENIFKTNRFLLQHAIKSGGRILFLKTIKSVKQYLNNSVQQLVLAHKCNLL